MTEGSVKEGRSRSVAAAVISAVIGAGCLHLYLDQYETEVQGGELVPVLSLTRDAVAGTVLDSGLLDVRLIPERYLDERHVPAGDLERVEGNPLQARLSAGDALLWTDLGLAEGARQLSTLVPVGRRGVRLSGSEVSFGGLLRPGDRVDVLITETSGLMERAPARTWTLLENVMVLAVGDRLSLEDDNQGRGAGAVTLSVLPAEASRLESHRARGSFRLALRNPDDLTLVSRGEVDHGH